MVWFIVYIQSCLILYTFGVCYSLYLVGSELFMLTAAAGEVLLLLLLVRYTLEGAILPLNVN